MRVLAVLWIVLCGICVTHAARHSLKYFYTAVTPGIEFPEFTTVGLLDDEPFTYYDSNIKRETPKTEWIKQSVDEQYWDRSTDISLDSQQRFKTSINIVMDRFNHTGGVHTLQWMYGCEWDDESGATGGFDQHGYDGKDFLSLDLKNLRFFAPQQQAFISANKWNSEPAQLDYEKQYITQNCVEWLQKYVRYGKSSLERTVSPEVSLLQKDPSSLVTCHVTGFYPRGVMVTWQKNGQDLDVDVELGETLPNGDGTFQTRSQLRVNPEDLKRDRYSCTVQHKSLEEDIVRTVGEGVPEGRSISPDNMGIIIGCVVGALLLLNVVIGVFVWKKRTSGYGKTSTTDTDSANSDPPAPKA